MDPSSIDDGQTEDNDDASANVVVNEPNVLSDDESHISDEVQADHDYLASAQLRHRAHQRSSRRGNHVQADEAEQHEQEQHISQAEVQQAANHNNNEDLPGNGRVLRSRRVPINVRTAQAMAGRLLDILRMPDSRYNESESDTDIDEGTDSEAASDVGDEDEDAVSLRMVASPSPTPSAVTSGEDRVEQSDDDVIVVVEAAPAAIEAAPDHEEQQQHQDQLQQQQPQDQADAQSGPPAQSDGEPVQAQDPENELNTPGGSRKRARSPNGGAEEEEEQPSTSNKSARTLDDSDDGAQCPICLDDWEMSGEHRLVSLKCGHLFGEKCIRRWCEESHRSTGVRCCPQCKARVAIRDIRHLFAKRLRCLDRTEEHRLRMDLEKEQRLHAEIKSAYSSLKMSYATVTSRATELQFENDRLKIALSTGQSYIYDVVHPTVVPNYRLNLQHNIELTREKGCRVMAFSNKSMQLIVSQKSAQSNLFPGFGVRFIDVPTFRTQHFLHTSSRILRDLCLNYEQNLLLTATLEPRVKLFDLRSRSTVAHISSNRPVWSCMMGQKTYENIVFLGEQQGSISVYDIRSPTTTLEEYSIPGIMNPVVSMIFINPNSQFTNGGFIVCHLQSVYFFEYCKYGGNETTQTRFDLEGPFISMSYNAEQETILIVARSNARFDRSRYILCKLTKVDNVAVLYEVVVFFSAKSTPIMTRATQIITSRNTVVVGYNQEERMLSVFDSARKNRVQSLPVHDVVYDVCPIYTVSHPFLAALTDTRCRVYKLFTTQ